MLTSLGGMRFSSFMIQVALLAFRIFQALIMTFSINTTHVAMLLVSLVFILIVAISCKSQD